MLEQVNSKQSLDDSGLPQNLRTINFIYKLSLPFYVKKKWDVEKNVNTENL